jgi:Uma2 family endonuclease
LALLRLRPDHFRESLPGPEDVLLVIEVADSSLSYDRETKLSLYARSGIPEAWVVDLASNGIEVHTDPGGAVYRKRQLATVGETVPLHALNAQPMEVATALLASV